MIKPIPTMYGGILYRSKLEACWAAFFTALGVRFDYELDAFELPSGNYLPDFYLHDVRGGVWVEIKPYDPGEHARQLCGELAAGTGHGVYLVWGSPASVVNDATDSMWPFFGWQAGPGGSDLHWSDYPFRFCICPRCERLCLAFEGNGETACGNHDSYGEDQLTYDHPLLVAAAIEAHRAVRWEPTAAVPDPPPVKLPSKVGRSWQRRHP